MKWSAEHQLEVIYKSLGFSAPQYTIPPKEPSISEILCASLFLNLVSIYKLGSSEKLTNLITVRAVPALDIKSLKEKMPAPLNANGKPPIMMVLQITGLGLEP